MLGVPVKPTIKEVDADGNVVKTLQRAALWEVQTPQVMLTLPQLRHASCAWQSQYDEGICWGE